MWAKRRVLATLCDAIKRCKPAKRLRLPGLVSDLRECAGLERRRGRATPRHEGSRSSGFSVPEAFETGRRGRIGGTFDRRALGDVVGHLAGELGLLE